jgi:hypothetical protein
VGRVVLITSMPREAKRIVGKAIGASRSRRPNAMAASVARGVGTFIRKSEPAAHRIFNPRISNFPRTNPCPEYLVHEVTEPHHLIQMFSTGPTTKKLRKRSTGAVSQESRAPTRTFYCAR